MSSQSLRERARKITIRGIVSPCMWDADNTVARVSILTFDDDEYEVERGDAGEYLLEHLRQEVMARGTLVEGRRRKVIQVKSFTVFNGEELDATSFGAEPWGNGVASA